MVIPDITFDFDTKRIEKLFGAAPRLTWRHVRGALFGVMKAHREAFLARTKVNFRPRGFRAPSVRQTDETGGLSGQARNFQYRVHPKKWKLGEHEKPDLSKISAETFTTSKIALGLEQGGTHRARAGRFLALPIGVTIDSIGRPKSRWWTPSSYLKASSQNQLLTIKKPGKAPVLYQVKGARNKRAAATRGAFSIRGGRAGKREKSRILLPAYVLVPRVKRKARLRYLKTWDELEPDRDRRFARAADRIMEDIDRGRSA